MCLEEWRTVGSYWHRFQKPDNRYGERAREDVWIAAALSEMDGIYLDVMIQAQDKMDTSSWVGKSFPGTFKIVMRVLF